MFLFEQLVRRELRQKYQGSVLGVAWYLINPLVLMAAYWFLFDVVLETFAYEDYPLFLLCGLVVWIFFSQTLTAASTSLLDQGALIRKARFPREAIPASVVAVQLVTFLTLLALVAVVCVVLRGTLDVALLVLPVVILHWNRPARCVPTVARFLAQGGAAAVTEDGRGPVPAAGGVLPGALEAGDPKERVREQLVAEGGVAAQGDVALRLERRRRLVDGAETDFQVIAAASRVGRFEGDPPRQLAAAGSASVGVQWRHHLGSLGHSGLWGSLLGRRQQLL